MRKFILSLLVMLMAGMDYALAATFPQLSTPDKPVLYYIRNTRQDKLVSLGSTTDFMDEIAATDKSQACMFWFESAGELINGTYQPVYIHNITTAKSLGHLGGWKAKGSKWYLRENVVNADYLGIGSLPGEEGNGGCWWNDNGGTKVKCWQLNGDQGSIWDIMPVPEEEIPAGLSVITWNLKKADEIISTVKSVAVQGVEYPAPFDGVAYNGSITATGGTDNQVVDVPYTETIPFTPSESVTNATWYKIKLRPASNYWLHYDNPEVSCNADNANKNDMGSYFAFVGNPIDGFRIYNAAIPAGNALGGEIFARLKAVPEAEAPAFILENNGVYVFRNPESTVGYLNDNGRFLAYWKSNYGATDGGSTWEFYPVDADLNTKINTAGIISYNFYKDGKVVGTQSARALGGDPFPTPIVAVEGYYAETPKGTVNGDATFNITLKPALPISKDYTSATWFRLMNRPNGNGDRYLCYQEGQDKYELKETAEKDDAYLWAIVGTPEEGFKIMNKAAGDGKYLSVNPGNGNCPTMTETPQVWTFKLQSGGSNEIFGLGVNGFWLNDYANNHFLSLWQQSPSEDVGSTLKIEEVKVIDGMYANANGAFEIASDEDFQKFVALLSKDNTANAILLADVSTNAMISCGDYQGVFEGNGHTININLTQNQEDGIALFRNIGTQGVIQNLKVKGTISTGKKFAGGIAAWNSGHIYGCYVDVTVESTLNGDATHGGVAGVAYRGTVIENCLVKYTINGPGTQNCGGVVGWANDPINIVNTLVLNHENTFDHNNGSNNVARNAGNLRTVNLDSYNQNIYANRPNGACYNNYVTQQWGDNVATTVVAYNDLADGKICYQLNNDQSKVNWVQQIGTDPFPVPAAFGSGRVYASAATGCNGKADGLTYSNEGTAQATAHTFDKYGICSVCGCFNFHYFDRDMSDGTYLLKSAADIDMAEGWNRIGDGFKLNMKMANDIEYKAEPGKYIFNTSNWVDGSFNGDGHVLTIEMSELGNYASFIPQHTGVFENVIMHGSISTSGQYAGSISGEGRQSAIRNVYSDINITSTRVGDNTSGGLLGMISKEPERVPTIDNCIYAGTFTLPGAAAGSRCARVGGFAGWTHRTTNVTNCAILGKFVGAGNQTLDNDTENSQNIARNPGSIVAKNVYVLNPIVGNSVSDHDKYTKIENPESVTNGELAFWLNESKSGGENFYQLIGTDPMPMPIANAGATVYAIADSYNCDGTPQGNIQFANAEFIPVLPDHVFEDGICENCGDIENDEDGYKMIINAKTLAQFAKLVNNGQTNLKVRMYEDIDMKGVAYNTAGSRSILFTGEFDGQGHVISNLNINGGEYTGLIGGIGGGAVIKNFVLDKTCSIKGGAYVGAIGGTNGSGSVYISNIGNEGSVTGSGVNASGIIGVDMGGSMNMFITNCYVTGAIKGSGESAVICSWSNDASVVENCWSIATIEGVYGNNTFTRGGTTVKNGYELEGIGTQNGDDHSKDKTNLITAEEVANGTLCYKLGGAFGQVLGVDAYPNLAAITGYNEVRYDDQYGFGYYNPLPLGIMDGDFENVTNASEDKTAVKSADVKGTFLLTEKADAFTENAIALIMDATEYQEKGIYGKHLFGALAKNGDFSIDADGKVAINFTSFSTHTDQPIFDGDLDRQDVGDVATDAKYVVAIIGGSLVADGITEKETLIKSYTGSDLLSVVIAEAMAIANGDDPTAINGVNTDNNNGAIYSITGVRVNKAQKGIYIINGKKVANK